MNDGSNMAGGKSVEQADTTARNFAIAAGVWAAAFAGLSFAWALGSELGLDKLSPTLVERMGDRNPDDLAVLWGTGAIKLAGAFVAALLATTLLPSVRRSWLAWLAIIGGAFCTLYGALDAFGGWYRWQDGQGNNAFWYMVLWGPIWLLGGLLFLALGIAWKRRGA